MQEVIRNILCKDIKPKKGCDRILSELFPNEIQIANKLKIIQMRLGKCYEEIAKEFNWIKVQKIDLINIDKKYACELKSSTNTDNSSSFERNKQKLLEFQKSYPDYKLFYLCINHQTKEPQSKLLDNNITYLTGNYALEFLYGKEYENILSSIRKCIIEIINCDTSKLRETPKASSTTSLSKDSEGTEVMTLLNGKIDDDVTMDNPQQSS